MIIRKKILVTGANGQLGKEFAQLYALYPAYEFIFLSKEQLDITNTESIKSAFELLQPVYVINCAAYTAVDKAEEETKNAFSINAEAAGNLAEICQQHACLLFHFSTDYVFDGNSGYPYKETDVFNPQSVYGASKLKGEQLVLEKNADAIILRTSWVYSEFGKNFVRTMLRLMAEKKEIKVVNDQKGSPTYAADIAEFCMQIIQDQQWVPGIYHYSNEGEITWYEFAEEIKRLTGSECIIHPVPSVDYPTPAKRPAYSVLDKNKVQQTFGIGLKKWQDSLKRCLSRIDLESSIN